MRGLDRNNRRASVALGSDGESADLSLAGKLPKFNFENQRTRLCRSCSSACPTPRDTRKLIRHFQDAEGRFDTFRQFAGFG